MAYISQSRSFLFFLLSVLALFLSVIFITQATTIGSNVDVSGNLTVSGTASVTGATTFTGAITANGNSTFGDAASDVNLFTGTLQASTTALFTGTITTYAGGTFGDATSDNYLFNGGLMASSTLGITGTTFLYGNVNYNGYSTSTAASGNIRSEGNLGLATSTSMTTGVVFGVEGTATTTIAIGTTSTTKGSCIQMDGPDGNTYRLFMGATTTSSGVLRVEQGSCNAGN